MFRQSALPLSLLVSACGGGTSSEADTGPSGTSGGAEETVALDMQAVLYTALHHDDERSDVWLRRRADAEPELLISEKGRAERVCVAPDGSGYVLWQDPLETLRRQQPN